MKQERRELPRERKPLLIRILLTLLVLGLAVVGVAAYLSLKSGSVTNTFAVERHPTVTVNSDYSVKLSEFDYAVYLRAAVVVNWVNGNEPSENILAGMPKQGTDYATSYTSKSNEEKLYNEDDWILLSDGFYYYREIILPDESGDYTTEPLFKSVVDKQTEEGYNIQVSIAAQTVQAVGQTDETDAESPVDAVYDAWGVTKTNITGSSN